MSIAPLYPMVSTIKKFMAHPHSVQFWLDPSTGIGYTRVADGQWTRVDNLQPESIPHVCYFI